MYILDFVPRRPIQLAFSCLLAYTALQLRAVYFPDLTLQKLHECLLHVDVQHCGKPDRDWLKTIVDPASQLQLSPKQQNALLKKYGELEKSITVSENCLVGVGYTNCEDINFMAVELF